MPHARASARRAACSAGVSGSNADASARSALKVSSAPSGSAPRSSASRLAAISSERWPPTIRTDRSAETTGTTIVRACPPATRWTSSDGSAVVRM